jgi:hypothetical protein
MKKCERLPLMFWVGLLGILTISIFLAGCGKETEIKKEQAPVTEMKKPGVTGIREFHEVLYPVWHSYLPAGNYKSIREAIPEFKRATKILREAELPQFYHNVKDDFENKRENLALAVEELESVAETDDDTKLAKAVEDMHTAFEQMVRVLAPRIRELDEFHLVLYPLWHQALPQKDYQAVKVAIPPLEKRLDDLMRAQLPQRFNDIKPKFIEKREALKRAVEELADVCRQDKDEMIIDRLTQMHQAYLELDEVFE